MKADLEILARELKMIAEEGWLPDGDSVTVPVVLWAEGWLLTLTELGIRPAPMPPSTPEIEISRTWEVDE